MSIIIKGMEMPKDGVYWCEIGIAGDIATITIHGEDRKSFPLVGLPPHGRLVDADALEAEPCDVMEDRGWYDVFGYSHALIRNAPTIIDAEEAEK